MSTMSKQQRCKRLVITTGESAGIGMDLAVMLAQRDWQDQLIVVADPDALAQRAKQLSLPLSMRIWSPEQEAQPSCRGEAWVLPVLLATACEVGRLNPANAVSVLAGLQAAVDTVTKGDADALVTGPVHKGVINEAGIAFTGHTEWLAEYAGNVPVVMMLACERLRVALATTHLPLRQVADQLSIDSLTTSLSILYRQLQTDFSIAQPRILVTGLNPHAGEGGHLGMEEIDIIQPVCRWAQAQGWQVSDPLSADTLFSPANIANTDAFFAMYHDQGLPILKHLCFGQAVNITLGLPYIRTSVDHGTALTLAGTGRAEVSSFIYAIDTAIKMSQERFNILADEC